MKWYILVFIISTHLLIADGTLKNYRNAEQFLPRNIAKLLPDKGFKPVWSENGETLWFSKSENNGKIYYKVVCSTNAYTKAFDHKKLAKNLSNLLKSPVQPYSMNLKKLKIGPDSRTITFTINSRRVTCNLKNYKCTSTPTSVNKKHGESPDGKWLVFIKDYNLFLKDIATGRITQLTTDGKHLYSYGSAPPNSWEVQNNKTPWFYIYWSPDSKKFATARFDYRKTGIMHMIKTPAPSKARPELISFPYSLPVDKHLPEAELVMYNLNKKELFYTSPSNKIEITWYFKPLNWYKDSRGFFYTQSTRGFRTISLKEMNAKSGAVRTIISETSKAGPVDPIIQTVRSVKDGDMFIWSSERSGWNHLYLYNGHTGKLINQITKGSYFVRSLNYVNEKKQKILYMASGRNKSRNPYYRSLYRVNFNGSGSKLLTVENAEHSVNIAPSGKYFIDTVSKHNMSPVYILKSSKNGKNRRILKRENITPLLATGWKYPEEFRTKAADGKTDIYGLIYKPRNFDPSKKYPVIDKIYTGPHNFFTPKSFRAFRSEAWSFAELGFIVIEVDGRGTGKRSKAFHNFSYKNLGRGSEDHVTAIKNLAVTRQWMDISRVGIYGFSAGGYDVARAMFIYPDFFKVGISASGNHDHRMDKNWWNELWMGSPVDKHYEDQSNITHAHKLKGKLLIVHGEMDTNVHPTSSLALVNALIEANRDFDFLIIPGKGHYLQDESPYYVRKRWDYFVKNLLGVTPPKEYKIK